ncbi:MAG: Rab family GTPase [Promethearchaeota archaeon]|jgi:small GTP-binding protein
MSISDYIFKLLLIGDTPGSKTAFVKRFCFDIFQAHEKLIIGVNFYSKTTTFKGKEVKLQIWDFGGGRKLRFLFSQYCKSANGAFFMYDITTQSSLDHLYEWTQIVRDNTGDIPIMLIGSKLDLNEYREVTYDEGLLIAKKYNLASFLEISSKTGENVEKAFETMIKMLIERNSQNTIEISNI